MTPGSIKEDVTLWNMRIENADMLDALLWHFAGMDLLTDAAYGNCVVLGYVSGWLDAIGAMIHVEKKKQGKIEVESGE